MDALHYWIIVVLGEMHEMPLLRTLNYHLFALWVLHYVTITML